MLEGATPQRRALQHLVFCYSDRYLIPCLFLHYLSNRQIWLRFAVVDTANLAPVKIPQPYLISSLGERNIAHLLSNLSYISQIECDKIAQFRVFLCRRAIDIDEKRPGERLVLSGLDGFGGGHHSAITAIDCDGLQLIALCLEIGKPKVAQTVGTGLNILHQGICHFRWRCSPCGYRHHPPQRR